MWYWGTLDRNFEDLWVVSVVCYVTFDLKDISSNVVSRLKRKGEKVYFKTNFLASDVYKSKKCHLFKSKKNLLNNPGLI